MHDIFLWCVCGFGALNVIFIFAACKAGSDYDDETERYFRSIEGD